MKPFVSEPEAATIAPPILLQRSSPRVKSISARLSSDCPSRPPKTADRIEGNPELICDRRQLPAVGDQVTWRSPGRPIGRYIAPSFQCQPSMLTEHCEAMKKPWHCSLLGNVRAVWKLNLLDLA
jgi:hypothetical protein